MALVCQRLNVERVPDVALAVSDQLAALSIAELVKPGMRIAVTGGSRGIADIDTILAAVVARFKAHGAKPFVIPAMGSHGGALPEGQTEILEGYGITETSMSCPIVSSLEVAQVGETPQGIPVFVDRAAVQADGIVVVNRVKPHTDFIGEIESGLMKMMVIGLGKYKGATIVHAHAVRLGLATAIPAAARVVLSKCCILFGLAVLENAYHQVARIVAIPSASIKDTEKALLKEARQMMGTLPVDDLDVLIVDQMGKNISGTGMDTNVIGRIQISGSPEPESPRITRIVVRDLTEATHGNAVGIGLADFTTRRLVEKIDYRSTYINVMAGTCPERGRVPVIAETDREAIEYAFSSSGVLKPAQGRVMRIRNTQDVEHLHVSESLLPEVVKRDDVEQASKLEPMSFDSRGMLIPEYVTVPE